MSTDDPAALRRTSFAGLAFLHAVLAVALFGPARTVWWWQAWAYLAVFLAATLAVTLHFLSRDPALIRRRLSAGPVAERRPVQKAAQAVASVCFVGLFVVSGLGRRHGWAPVPAAVSLAADALVVAGFAIVFLVFRVNSHTSATIGVSAGQRVVTTGPYRHVRHPMYSGALLLLAATPAALGSISALPFVVGLAAVLVVRIADEERLLTAELPGYAEYRREVRHRLVPGVW